MPGIESKLKISKGRMKEKNMLTYALIFLLTLFFTMGSVNKVKGKQEKTDLENVTLITAYDNYGSNPELKTSWGFSCLVKIGNASVLFDVGGDSKILLSNLEKLHIDPKEIDLVVLSHIHGDHVGGLEGLLEVNPKVTVYLPRSFPASFKQKVTSYGAKVIEVSSPTQISEGIYSTGELGVWIKEQSLIVKTEKGLVVITGCSHPGIVTILKKVKKLHHEEIFLVLGGFHLSGANDPELRGIIKDFRELGVEKVAPSHCSGDRTRKLFKEEYGADFIANGVGKVICI